jgi:MFS family permease
MQESEVNIRSVSAATGAWIGLLVGANAMLAATNSNFMKPLAQAFGVNRGAISAALSISPLIVAMAVPVCGWAMDRFGLRRVLIPGVIAFGLLMLAMSRVTSIWEFALLQIALGVAVSMHSSVGYAKVVSQWFDRWRGLVLGLIVALGAGVGQTAMPLVSQWLISHYGWRTAFVGIALIILCFGLPLIALLVREPRRENHSPSHPVASLESPGRQDPGTRVGEALRRPTFWLIFIAILFGSMTLLGTLQHAVPMITEHGFDVNVATEALSFTFAGVVTGQLTSGILVNQINTPKVIVPYFAAALAGLLIVHSVHRESGAPLLFTGTLLMGLGLGGEVAQNAYLISRYFGLRSFGTLYGLTFAASNVGIAIGTVSMGKVHDMAHSYAPMRVVFGACMAISTLCIFSLGPYARVPKAATGPSLAPPARSG